MENLVNIGLYLAYAMVGLAGLGAIVLPLVNAISQPKQLVKGLMGVAGLVVLYFISWAVAGSEVTAMYTEKGITASSSQLIGGALTLFYLLTGIALIGIAYTEISRLIK